MDLLKTPHHKLLEEAGAVPDSPGLLKTPRQLLFEESGMLPKYAQGKSVRDMQAEIYHNELAAGGQPDGDPHDAFAKVFNAIFS